jgi:threonine synthase
VRLDRLGARLGLGALYAKLESQSPTASFKDRGATVLVSMLKEAGVREVVEDSSGNAGAAIAAYAARAGIAAHIFAPATAPQAKVQQIRIYGARTHLVDGPRDAATAAAISYVAEHSSCYASHNLSPYFLEGTKTFAYEVADPLIGGLPDHVVIPVGNGSLLIGMWKGFLELRAGGRISQTPRLHGIQAEGIQPIVAAYLGEEWSAQPGVTTVAGGIAVAEPPRREQAARAMRNTGGMALAVADDDVLRWQRLLAAEEGVYAEPTSAAAFAGLEQLVLRGHILPGESVLVPVTGSGLKDTALV